MIIEGVYLFQNILRIFIFQKVIQLKLTFLDIFDMLNTNIAFDSSKNNQLISSLPIFAHRHNTYVRESTKMLEVIAFSLRIYIYAIYKDKHFSIISFICVTKSLTQRRSSFSVFFPLYSAYLLMLNISWCSRYKTHSLHALSCSSLNLVVIYRNSRVNNKQSFVLRIRYCSVKYLNVMTIVNV